MRLKGKTALVTAAGAGIGRASAVAFAREGAKVIATDIDELALDEVAEIEGIESRLLDVTSSEAVTAVVGELGSIDILLNCAGFVHHGSILACDEDEFHRSVELNVSGTYRMTRAVLPKMIERKQGSIISISSVISSFVAAPDRFVYGATKAAVVAMMKSVAADFVTSGIRANAICPGTVETPSWHARVREAGARTGDVEAVRKAFIDRQPMGRIGQPEEVADLAVYLASDESRFVTGQAIAVDGGWSNV